MQSRVTIRSCLGFLTTLLIAACGGGGGDTDSSAAPAPTVTLTSSASSIASGSSVTLTWSSTNATSCTASDGWTGTKATSGSEPVGPLNANASYTLSCSGAGGSANHTASVSVTAPAGLQITSGDPPDGTVGVIYNKGTGPTCSPSGNDCHRCTPGGSTRSCGTYWIYEDSFLFRAAGGVLPYRWAAVGLPPGLDVSADGAFLLNSSCCSPQAAGTYAVVVTVTDSESPANQESAIYEIVIGPPSPTALVATTVAPGAQMGPPTPDDRSVVGSAPIAAGISTDEALDVRHVPVKREHTSIKEGYSKRDIQLKFVEGSGVELRGESFVSADVDVTAVNDLLSSVPALRVAPIFTSDSDQLRREKVRLQELSGRDLADLSLYFHVTLLSGATGMPAKRLAERLIDAFNALPMVEFAQPVPKPAPPPSSNLSKHRQYEFAVLEGIGAMQVTGVPGVHGDHVQIVDIEYNWNDNHEDLTAARRLGAFIPNGSPVYGALNDQHYGTAVASDRSADDNDSGVTAIVPNARLRMVNAISSRTDEGQDVANAIHLAALDVGAGDVILLNHQTPGPNYLCSTDDQCGLVAIEYDEVVYAAITWATARGIIVVEAAGNGHQNLDGPEYADTFNTTTGRPGSGAIIVGAGASPADCEEESGKPAASRLDFSNYGEFVDIQGWGECSSASPIVAGAAAAYSSATEATTGAHSTSWQVRQALVSTGTPQDITSQNALEGKVGPLPNLLTALALIGTSQDFCGYPIYCVTVTAPVQTIAQGKAGSTVPITVSWTAQRTRASLAYTELWRSTNGGNFVRDTTLSRLARSRTYSLPVGSSYRFLVRGYDSAGNGNAAAYGPTFTPTVKDDRSTVVRYFPAPGSTTRSWTYRSWNQAYKGTLTKSTKASEYARYTFTGRDVAYVASLGSNQGQATVKIDGIAYSTVNLYRSTSAGAQIVVSRHWASLGTHTIEVRTANTFNTSYPTAIDVDAFVVNQ